jgi:5'-nucleotidase
MRFKLLTAGTAFVVLWACSGSDDPATPTTQPTPSVAVPFTVKLIGFNDYHGNLESPGTFGTSTAVPVAERPPVGGAKFIAAHVAKLKSQNLLNVVVGAGDMIGATPLISSFFSDEPAIETLNRIGLEFSSVGNHEFDKGASEL